MHEACLPVLIMGWIGSADKFVFGWDLETGKVTERWSCEDWVKSVAAHDGYLFAGTRDGHLLVIHTAQVGLAGVADRWMHLLFLLFLCQHSRMNAPYDVLKVILTRSRLSRMTLLRRCF